jgi:predicted nucleic acid-binding protein
MRKTIIVNSTPILALHEIGQLEILKKLYGEIIIPDAVRREVTVKDANTLTGKPWIVIAPITNLTAKELFTTALHDGEVEVMLLAKERGADLVIIDDGLARRHAKFLKLTVTGTIGVLLRAKSNGVIKAVKPVLDDLIRCGFYLSDDVYREVLRLAAE